MRVKKSEIKTGVLPSILKKKTPSAQPKDRTDEILSAIKENKPDHVVVEQQIPDEVIENQREILDEVRKKPELPTYNFDVKRDSQGFIKNVIASPVVDGATVSQEKLASSWYGDL